MKNFTQFAVIPVILTLAFGLTILLSQTPKTLPEGDNLTELSIKGVSLQVDVADTPWARQLGLSGRTSLGENEGMLFILDVPSRPSFWMKDMRFAIDIIWIGEDKVVTEINPRVSPDTFPQAFRPHTEVRYVLEVNSGLAEKYGWKVGDKVQF